MEVYDEEEENPVAAVIRERMSAQPDYQSLARDRNERVDTINMGEALTGLASSFAPEPPKVDFSSMREAAGNPVKDYIADRVESRNAAAEGRATRKMGIAEQDRDRLLDPTQASSARMLAKQRLTMTGANPSIISDDATLRDLSDVEKGISGYEDAYTRRENAKALANFRQTTADQKPTKLVPEDQAIVSSLSIKNAGKVSIGNQLDAMLGDWDSLSEEDKLARGRIMIKTLNSTEGADAVGAEEAKRLGSKLVFALGNLSPFNDDPIQFGRDLEGFRRQAQGTLDSIRNSVAANAKEVSKITGRAPRLQPEIKNKPIEVDRKTKDGRTAVFDTSTTPPTFVRYKD